MLCGYHNQVYQTTIMNISKRWNQKLTDGTTMKLCKSFWETLAKWTHQTHVHLRAQRHIWHSMHAYSLLPIHIVLCSSLATHANHPVSTIRARGFAIERYNSYTAMIRFVHNFNKEKPHGLKMSVWGFVSCTGCMATKGQGGWASANRSEPER